MICNILCMMQNAASVLIKNCRKTKYCTFMELCCPKLFLEVLFGRVEKKFTLAGMPPINCQEMAPFRFVECSLIANNATSFRNRK